MKRQCVSRLKAAGALVMGKTVTTEFAYFEPGADPKSRTTLNTRPAVPAAVLPRQWRRAVHAGAGHADDWAR